MDNNVFPSVKEKKGYKFEDCRVDIVLGLLARRQHGRVNSATLTRSLFSGRAGADRCSWHDHQPYKGMQGQRREFTKSYTAYQFVQTR